MGVVGNVIGCLVFAMAFFAALTSALSVMESLAPFLFLLEAAGIRMLEDMFLSEKWERPNSF